jgi:hypothetical protein
MRVILDPPEPPEGGGSMRAKDLVNKVCVFRPVSVGEWPAKPATEHEKAMKAQPYVECDVWVLDRAGVIEEGSGVRVGWWKAVEQLKGSLGQYVGAKPRTEEGSNAIYLAALSGEARAVAEQAVATLAGSSAPVAQYDQDEEPF